nr:hypothetical protein [Clostridia bacterium]
IFSLTLENLHPSLDNIRFYILNSKNLDIYIILFLKKVLHLILQFSKDILGFSKGCIALKM